MECSVRLHARTALLALECGSLCTQSGAEGLPPYAAQKMPGSASLGMKVPVGTAWFDYAHHKCYVPPFWFLAVRVDTLNASVLLTNLRFFRLRAADEQTEGFLHASAF